MVYSVFSAKLITASDMQNIELFNTQSNSGVGIRTAKGNTSVCGLLEPDEKVVNIFDTVQNGIHNFLVHTENTNEGRFYLFDIEAKELVKELWNEEGVRLVGISLGKFLIVFTCSVTSSPISPLPLVAA